ncbi:hypothetical protein MTR67_019097 [Solanum verrucosum]|uniref:Uncharacterized protein n=1 Tax=Solanum verrucosum TaxID=315347 RepID=A0AAF0QN23_SOLVR|nr:hypothetical protein MTR67_019097 [Solanum verrucosum]
MWISSLLV